MERRKLIFPLIRAIFSNPRIILKSLYHGLIPYERKNYIDKKYSLQNGLMEVDLIDLFPNFKETVDPYSHLYGTSLPIDLALLKAFARNYAECEYLEIGSWRGESLANLSPICKRCVSVSLSDDEMRKIGMSEEVISMQRYYSKGLANVTHIGANSQHFDFSNLGKFDLIFVDGDHRYAAVKNDTKTVFNLLKNKDSVIIWHDYTEHYEKILWEVLAGILDGTDKDQHNHLYHISNTSCAVYINKQLPSHQREETAIPKKSFKIGIEVNK